MCSTCVGEALNSLVFLDTRTICNNFGLDLDVQPSPVHRITARLAGWKGKANGGGWQMSSRPMRAKRDANVWTRRSLCAKKAVQGYRQVQKTILMDAR